MVFYGITPLSAIAVNNLPITGSVKPTRNHCPVPIDNPDVPETVPGLHKLKRVPGKVSPPDDPDENPIETAIDNSPSPRPPLTVPPSRKAGSREYRQPLRVKAWQTPVILLLWDFFPILMGLFLPGNRFSPHRFDKKTAPEDGTSDFSCVRSANYQTKSWHLTVSRILG